MKRVLMVSPHFPPDSSAGTHRVRLVAPHLPKNGWEPTVLTVDPRGYEGRLDADLARLVPGSVRVVRAAALESGFTRRVGIGDLGLRAWPGLRREARRLLSEARYDVLFITTYPLYPALLGRGLKRAFDVPYVVDLQDPWVGAWGASVGAGPGGTVDWRSRASRAVASRIEPRILGSADACTAVSDETLEAMARRWPDVMPRHRAAIPLGAEPADFAAARAASIANPIFDPADGLHHVVYVGTLLPRGTPALRAVLEAVDAYRRRRPEAAARLRLHFVGTGNQSVGNPERRTEADVRRLGLETIVSEHPLRIPYLAALRVLLDARLVLVLGSDEPHYTPSKVFPALLSERPVLALLHRGSEAARLFEGGSASRRLIAFDSAGPSSGPVEDALAALLQGKADERIAPSEALLAAQSAEAMAARFATVFDGVRR